MGAALWNNSSKGKQAKPAAAAAEVRVGFSVWRFLSSTSDRLSGRLRSLSGRSAGAKIGDGSARLELTDQSSRRDESSLDLSFSGKGIFLPPSREPSSGSLVAEPPLVLRSSEKGTSEGMKSSAGRPSARRLDVSQTSLRSQHT